jgi:N-acetyl-gamma-glutamyl-phosphate reductase
MLRAAVLGATGYLGGELLRVLSQHPSLDVVLATSGRQAGATLGSVYPGLSRFSELVLSADADRADADVAFLALPATESMAVVPSLLERGIRVVDLGPDYRLKDPAEFRRVYGKPHADPGHLAEAVYGLPELGRDAIRSARLVANPGCYPTATLLAVAPLWRAGLVEGPIVVDAKSGTSGAGASPTPTSHHPEAAGTVWPYGTPEHRHLPEMRQALASAAAPAPPIVFVPHLVPLVRGILCSIYVRSTGPFDPLAFASVYARSYADSPFVRVGGVPRLPWAAGTNRCFLSVVSVGGAPVIFSALDNLGKGGATQAIQNANLLLGLEETLGLTQPGFAV